MPKHRIVAIAAGLLTFILLSQQAVMAQSSAPPSAAPQTSPVPQPSSVTPPAATEKLLKAEELDALVAPIALYPDNLLSLVLMASTYPIEVVQADRFVKDNSKLTPEELKAAVDKQSWDDSVKALTATPDVLTLLNSRLDWMESLGNAVLAQQPDVMDAIQRLRGKAAANNKLASTKEQTVVRRQEGGRQVIAIEPTNPETLFVPYFDPTVVYGAWPYADYPPYYFEQAYWPGYIPGAIVATGIAFGAGWALGHWASGGNYWGGDFNWNDNHINVNRPRVNPLAGNNWQHNPAHRGGVRYDNPRVEQRFGGGNAQGGRQNMDFRGRDGNQVLRPDGGRPGAGAKAGQLPGGKNAGKNAGNLAGKGGGKNAAQRPAGGGKNAAKRPGGGSKAAQRPSGGSKAAHRPAGAGNKAAQRPASANRRTAQRPSGGRRPTAQRPRAPSHAMARGGPSRANMGGGGRGGFSGGGRGGGRGGGGRRSDINLKHDIVWLGQLPNGLGFYRFSYNGEQRAYVGVMAQEVENVMPSAVIRDREGHLRVLYEKLGVPFQTYENWLASGGKVPIVSY